MVYEIIKHISTNLKREGKERYRHETDGLMKLLIILIVFSNPDLKSQININDSNEDLGDLNSFG